jgi:anti-anti-sigma regulatory factor
MSVRLEQTEDSSLIQLNGLIDIASAADFKSILVEAVKRGKKICISAEKASDLDLTIFQLLWATRCEAQRSGIGFVLTGKLPEPVRNAWRQMGLDALATTS